MQARVKHPFEQLLALPQGQSPRSVQALKQKDVMRKFLDIIKMEHQALAAVLRSINMLIAQQRQDGSAFAFDAFRAMLFYIDEFPEKRHHKKETELLFPKLRARAPRHRELLDRLDGEHHLGEARIRELEHALLEYEMMGEPRRAHFEGNAARYVEFYFNHMRLEEREVLPLAEEVLKPADWAELDEAFAQNRDPLTGCDPEAEYEALFKRIVNLVPAPIGLGPATSS
jgi:hemerythrin-like domain-containing protein